MLIAPTDDVPELNPELERQAMMNSMRLYDADPRCAHHVVEHWNGIKCTKCTGWFCR